MNFGNNIEAMGFEKSGWSLVETSPDGSVVYKGKPKISGATESMPVWYIIKIVITVQEDGSEIIKTMQAINNGNISWEQRKILRYTI